MKHARGHDEARALLLLLLRIEKGRRLLFPFYSFRIDKDVLLFFFSFPFDVRTAGPIPDLLVFSPHNRTLMVRTGEHLPHTHTHTTIFDVYKRARTQLLKKNIQSLLVSTHFSLFFTLLLFLQFSPFFLFPFNVFILVF